VAMSTGFSIALEPPWEGRHVVRVVGELDSTTSPQVDDFLGRQHGDVRVDCTELSRIDASGVWVLLKAAARLASLRLVNVNADVLCVLEQTEATSLLGVPSLRRRGLSRR
jgi:anti-anti-sigma factor